MAEWSGALISHGNQCKFESCSELLHFLQFLAVFQQSRAIEGSFLSNSRGAGLSIGIFVIHVLSGVLWENLLWKSWFLVHRMCLNCVRGSNPKLSKLILAFFYLFYGLKNFYGAIYVQNLPLKSKNHKIGKYFVAKDKLHFLDIEWRNRFGPKNILFVLTDAIVAG